MEMEFTEIALYFLVQWCSFNNINFRMVIAREVASATLKMHPTGKKFKKYIKRKKIT